MKVKPITPDEINLPLIPSEVIDVFNRLICRNYRTFRKEAVIKQIEVLNEIKLALGIEKTDIIFDNEWLDVEDIFSEVGWIVKYEKPAYNEDFDAYFVFKKPKKSILKGMGVET